MGFFTKEITKEREYGEEHTHRVANWTRIAGTGIASTFAALATASTFYINEARQVSLEIRFGDVVDTVTDPGIKQNYLFLHLEKLIQ